MCRGGSKIGVMNSPAEKRFPVTKFFFLSILFPLFLLGVAEFLCRWWIAPAAQPGSPQSIFEKSADEHSLRVRPIYLSSFHDLRIHARKEPGTLRIVCLGGSSTYGFPFGIESAFPRWLERLLAEFHSECRGEVLNLGAMSYGSRRILASMPEFLSLQPDLVLIYSGHNEFVEKAHAPAETTPRVSTFLEEARLFQVLRETLGPETPTDSALDLSPEVYRETVILGSESERQEVVSLFEKNYEAILWACRQAGVAVVAATVPSNIRDWRPDGSRRFRSGREEEWQQHFERGEALAKKGQPQEALEELDAAASIDPGHAMLQYLRGQCFLALERYPEAKEALELARDNDAAPQRAFRSINQSIRNACLRIGVPCLDLVKSFENESEQGLIRGNLIEDYVHPTVAAHQRIAAEYYAVLPDLPGFPASARRPEEETLRYLASLEKPEPTGPSRAAFHYNLGLKFINQGNWARVVETNREAVRCDPNHALACNNLGRGLQEMGKLDEALECYRKAAKLRPDIPGIHRNMGTVHQAKKQPDEAVAAFKLAIHLRADDAQSHYLLATALAEKDRMKEAIDHYHEAIRLDPRCFEAYANLGLAYALGGQKDRARAQWEKALQIRPGEPVVAGWLKEFGQ